MSQFSQFFEAASGASAGQAGNIFAGIRPPKMATFGNSHNYSVANQWATENFIIPELPGYALGINFGSKVVVATWNNVPVWSANDGVTGGGSIINGFIYNQKLSKWYLSTTVTGAGVYDVNMLTGARTLVTAVVPAFLSQSYPDKACRSYCTADGLYEWRDGDTIRKYSQAFVEVQRRTFVAANNVNSYLWYYTEDCKVRAQSITSWKGHGSASGITVNPLVPILVIERFGSRRIVQLTAEMVFSARGAPLLVGAMTPMVPVGYDCFMGNAVRLAKDVRDTSAVADSYLVDRVDYDRWLNDVADALGMPAGPAFYGDWVNV
ncbi:MAG: hypothetical protein K2Y25_14475 [Pseudomonadaceae bacterium]|nr:hypothetical protein [Pseudomonadaceae bacterium]